MWPMIGGLRIYTFVYVLSMFAYLAAALFYCRRMGFPKKVGVALSGCYVFGMAVGARILCDLLNQRFHWRNYLDLHYYFTDGMWGGPLAYLMVAVMGALLLGRDRARLFDLIALTLPIPMILAKVACLLNGCCYGAPSDVPWALSFPEGAKAPAGIPRHPTQLYEIVVLIVIAIVFHRLDRARWRGTLLLWFVTLYGIGRPFTEWFREAPERVPTLGPITASQAVCLTAGVVSALVLAWARASAAATSAATDASAAAADAATRAGTP